jgi:hypothetical protein
MPGAQRYDTSERVFVFPIPIVLMLQPQSVQENPEGKGPKRRAELGVEPESRIAMH